MGFERPNGGVGVRNKLLVIAVSDCAYHTAVSIADSVEGAIAVTQRHSCLRDEMVENQLIGIANNPNIAAVMLVGLGCESLTTDVIGSEIRDLEKPVDSLEIQEEGGTVRTIEKGTRILKEMAGKVSRLERKALEISNLTVALECGGSDSTSGLAANPAVGEAVDTLIEMGGTAILTECTEMMGAKHILRERGVNENVSENIDQLVQKAETWTELTEGIPKGISEGNKKGGLTTIEEKSLGAILKGGNKPIEGVLENSREKLEKPQKPGLYLQDCTGWDVPSMSCMIAAGAQIVIFTTGRGSPVGHAIAPVIKVMGNPNTYANMTDDVDINAGRIVEGEASIEEVGDEILDSLINTASGEKTSSEALGHKEFGIWISNAVAESLAKRLPEGEQMGDNHTCPLP